MKCHECGKTEKAWYYVCDECSESISKKFNNEILVKEILMWVIGFGVGLGFGIIIITAILIR